VKREYISLTLSLSFCVSDLSLFLLFFSLLSQIEVRLVKKYLPRARPRLNLYEFSVGELRYRSEQQVRERRETERGRERQRETQRKDKETTRDRDTETEIETNRARQIHIGTERDRQRESRSLLTELTLFLSF
jgi:hypothetical protein